MICHVFYVFIKANNGLTHIYLAVHQLKAGITWF